MNKNTFIIKLLSGCFAFVLLLCLAGCKKDAADGTSSVESEPEPEVQSTASVLVPIEATFDEKYTRLSPAKSGDDINIKGNVGVNVTADGSKVFDPNTYEAIDLKGTYVLGDGLGVGSTCADFMNYFGIKRGYYTAYDGDSNAVDVTVESKKAFTVKAILKFDEATEKITYVAGGKVGEHTEGLDSAGVSYLSGAEIGNDILVVTLFVKGDLIVECFTIVHYII